MSTKNKKRHKEHLVSSPELVSMGVALMNRGDGKGAEKTWRKAAEQDPQCADAWRYLTEFLALHKREAEALACLQKLIATSDRTPASLYALADKCGYLKQYGQARQFLNESLAMNPPPDIWLDASLLLAKIQYSEKDWMSSVETASQILQLHPNHLEALSLRMHSYFALAWTAEGVADCQLYLQLKPDADMHSRLLFKLNCVPDMTCEVLYQESVRWSNIYAAPLASEIRPHTNDPNPDRRLKIGYLSPDFRHHAIMRLLPGVFENHDKENFEIFAYSINTQPDLATDLVRKWVDHFIELSSSRQQIVRQVRRDGIDILVDLGAHTMPVDALLAFAAKPAPIQASWMGVLATTGLSTIDYFIGDDYMPCPGTEHLFTETVYRLPRVHACYRPLESLETAPSPYFTNNYITFGSFNNPNKINRDVVKVWSVILHLHPGSKLFLKYLDLNHEIGQRRLRKWFLEDGIGDDRLLFEGAEAPQKFLMALNRVDIALDPFPYNGGTTTLDTLWMGVPVVSLAGRLAVARGGACLLASLGLPVAQTWEQYVALAGLMAKAVPEQPDSRIRLRETMRISRLMNGADMTRTLESAYRDMWRKWCGGRQTTEAVLR